MKRIVISLTCIIFTLGLVGCVSSSTYNDALEQIGAYAIEISNAETKIENLENNIIELKNEIATIGIILTSTESEREILAKENKEIKEEIDYLKNGPSALLIEVKKNYENENYTAAITYADKLRNEFTGLPEDIEAQRISEMSKERLDEIRLQKEAEAAEALAEASKSARDKARDVITVHSVRSSTPNSAGGVDVYVKWTNNSENEIKYASFYVEPLNGVGDAVNSSIGNKRRTWLEDDGPYKKGQGNNGSSWYWGNIWYNSTIKSIRLLEVEIEYMDGTIKKFDGKDFDYKW